MRSGLIRHHLAGRSHGGEAGQPRRTRQAVGQGHAVPETPAETKTDGLASHALFKDAGGVVRVESLSIPNMGHGVALDPKSGCGKAGPFALDVGLYSTERAAAFFLGKDGALTSDRFRASPGRATPKTATSSQLAHRRRGRMRPCPAPLQSTVA